MKPKTEAKVQVTKEQTEDRWLKALNANLMAIRLLNTELENHNEDFLLGLGTSVEMLIGEMIDSLSDKGNEGEESS